MRFLQVYPTITDLRGRRQLGQFGTYREQIDALDAEYRATGREMHTQSQSCYPPPLDSGKRESWTQRPVGCFEKYWFLLDVWSPLIDSWEIFRNNRQEWWEAPWSGTDIKAFRERLMKFRESAKQVGFRFAGPEPVTPPESPGIVEGISKLAKLGIIGGLLIGGIFIAYKVLPPGKAKT